MQPDDYLLQYSNLLAQGLQSVDPLQLDKAITAIVHAHLSKGTVLVCGNGGSAAISDHFLCDHSKGVCQDTGFLPKVRSLSSNIALLTAIANDMSFDDVFSYQIDMFGDSGDVLFCISSSGNSPNILKAIDTAKKAGIKTIAMVGFDGGQAKNIADIVLHVPVNNYGVVEDAHQALMHIMAQLIRIKHTTKVDIKL